MPDKFIWYKQKVAGPFDEITKEWIDRWTEIVDSGKAEGVPNTYPINKDMEDNPNYVHVFEQDTKDGTTILADIIGTPPRYDEFEMPDEYIERVTKERWEDIYDAVKFDIAMGTVVWEQVEDVTVEEFSAGWTKLYIENLINMITFEELPIYD